MQTTVHINYQTLASCGDHVLGKTHNLQQEHASTAFQVGKTLTTSCCIDLYMYSQHASVHTLIYRLTQLINNTLLSAHNSKLE